jgi:hypothetical protein
MLPLPQLIISWAFLISLNIQAIFITTDDLQNVYAITAENSLIKFDSTGIKQSTYNQIRYGQLKFVDATNPLKIILSYPDYGMVVMLDNTLSEIAVISLKLYGIHNYASVCFSSRDNNFWVYDEDEYKLKKLDRNGNTILTSTDMIMQLGETIHPVYMQEANQYLYMSDTTKGILVFDLYGVYYETLPFTNVKKFQVKQDQIFFSFENELHRYQMKTLDEKGIVLPDSTDAIDLRLENNRLYLLTKDELKFYTY